LVLFIKQYKLQGGVYVGHFGKANIFQANKTASDEFKPFKPMCILPWNAVLLIARQVIQQVTVLNHKRFSAIIMPKSSTIFFSYFMQTKLTDW